MTPTGIEAPDDPEEAFYRWVEEQYGATASRFARHGLVGGATRINIKGSLQIGIGDIPTTTKDFLGAPYSVLEDVGSGIMSIAKGDVVKGAERIAPRILAGPIRAAREATEGVTTRTNQPLYFGAEPMKADWYDTFLRSFGFNPSRIAAMREKQWKDRKTEAQYGDERSEIYTRVRRYMLRPPAQRSPGDWMQLLQEIENYNARVLRRKLPNISLITPSTLSRIATNMTRPNKRERVRAGMGRSSSRSSTRSSSRQTRRRT